MLSLILNKKIILFLFFMSIQWVNSQNSPLFHIPDSLKNKTYKELFNGLNLSYNDTIKERIYAIAYLHKAKNENDTIKIAHSYSQFAQIASFHNPNLALTYADSIINLTKNLNNYEYPGFGYMIKGVIYYNLGDYKKALNQYLIANKYATKNNNQDHILFIKNAIGRMKNFRGNHKEALVLFKSVIKQLNQLTKNEFLKENRVNLLAIYGISNSYLFAKKYDSALIYVKKGIHKSLELKDSLNYYNFVSQAGIVAYYQNNFEIALDSINKAAIYSNSKNDFLNDHYYRGLIYHKQNKESKAFYYFKKADSICNLTTDVVPEVRDIQAYFVNYYKKNNDIKNQLIYINRLLYVDSIMSSNYKNLNETLVKKYDTPILLSKKEKIIANLKTNERKSSFTINSLITLGLLSILSFIWYYRKQRVLKARFKNLFLNKDKKTFTKIPLKKVKKELNGISKKIVKSVLFALKEFEINSDFLDNQLTLTSLSKELNTNSNYLSKIINNYKEQNFSTYISNLRINYCVEKLKIDATFRKYTINAIAFEIGFNNEESFSKAFYKKTGIYPSYFIKKIEEQN
ncbi:MAG: hypothetical protein COC22_02445 [Flavobacteriaceae bacterium]|nr:MAG: hypothetical protein COC22_02445 [Flavobacteriaceae bacterium]